MGGRMYDREQMLREFALVRREFEKLPPRQTINARFEVEITPEMVEAGVAASFDEVVWDETPREDCVRAILEAALEVSLIRRA